jgi:hypothetical protein
LAILSYLARKATTSRRLGTDLLNFRNLICSTKQGRERKQVEEGRKVENILMLILFHSNNAGTLYGDEKSTMSMTCQNFGDLVRLNKQAQVGLKYATMLRKALAAEFAKKFLNNLEVVQHLLGMYKKNSLSFLSLHSAPIQPSALRPSRPPVLPSLSSCPSSPSCPSCPSCLLSLLSLLSSYLSKFQEISKVY